MPKDTAGVWSLSRTRDGSASPAPVMAGRTRPSGSTAGRGGGSGSGSGGGGLGCSGNWTPTSSTRTAASAASGHSAATMRRIDSDEAEDRKSAADALAQARIAAAPTTARITAGWRKGSSGARVHGGSRMIPPPERRRGVLGLDRGGAGGDSAVPTDPGRLASMVVLTPATVSGGTDGRGGFVT